MKIKDIIIGECKFRLLAWVWLCMTLSIAIMLQKERYGIDPLHEILVTIILILTMCAASVLFSIGSLRQEINEKWNQKKENL